MISKTKAPGAIDVRRFGMPYWTMMVCAPLYFLLIPLDRPDIHLFVRRTVVMLPVFPMMVESVVRANLSKENRPKPDRNALLGDIIALCLYIGVQVAFFVHENSLTSL